MTFNAFAQQRDTLAIYKKIKEVAYKSKVSKLIYHAIFVDIAPKKYEGKPLTNKEKKKDPNLRFNGMVIRKITFQVYDPFGYSVNDTTQRATNPLQKIANRYHVTTRHKVLENLLLFEKNDTVDLLKISESERIIRQSRYINDARIYITSVPGKKNRDSVDVKVVVHDKWAIDAGIGLSTTSGNIDLTDRNILGLGQRYEQEVSYNVDGNYRFANRYNMANIRHSYVSSDLFFANTNDVTQVGLSFDRPFYSALATWAGGVYGSKSWGSYFYADTLEQRMVKTDLDHINTDAWIGRNIKPFKGLSDDEKTSNFLLGLRYVGAQYQKRPSFEIDTTRANSNSSLYLGNVGFSLSKYYKDQYIFRFGANEDVPQGVTIQWVYGLLEKEFRVPRYYAGFELSGGWHFKKLGYISAYSGYGTLFNKGFAGNATINAGIIYFGDLAKSVKWYYRPFVYVKYIGGINKLPGESIGLRSDELYGFNTGEVRGKSKLLLNVEGVAYAPYNFLGFKFAPVVLAGIGLLGTDDIKMFDGPLYQAYAIGLLMRNENLLSSSLKITLGWYPPINGKEAARFKLNPVATFTLKVRSFGVSRPEMVAYN